MKSRQGKKKLMTIYVNYAWHVWDTSETLTGIFYGHSVLLKTRSRANRPRNPEIYSIAVSSIFFFLRRWHTGLWFGAKMCVVFESTLGHQTPDLMATGLSAQRKACQANDLLCEEWRNLVTEHREWMNMGTLSISLGARSLAGLVEGNRLYCQEMNVF